jgi:hypothetical protein
MPSSRSSVLRGCKALDKDWRRGSYIVMGMRIVALCLPCFVVTVEVPRQLVIIAAVVICAVPFSMSLFRILRSRALSFLAWCSLAASLVFLAGASEFLQKGFRLP